MASDLWAKGLVRSVVLLSWLGMWVLTLGIWQRLGQPGGSLAVFAESLVKELAAIGALQLRGGRVHNA